MTDSPQLGSGDEAPGPHLSDATDTRPDDAVQLPAAGQRYSDSIRTLKRLADASDSNYLFLRQIAERSLNPYQMLLLRKHPSSSKYRKIHAPNDELMEFQRWLLKTVLTELQIHPISYAYRQNRSIVDCANQHLGAKWMFKMDLRDFFGSVKEDRIYRIFQHLGFPELLSYELSRLTTYSQEFVPRTEPQELPAYPSGVYKPSQSPAYLPQGAPTSGALANAAAANLDIALAKFAQSSNLTVTRYSDDIIFSSRDPFSRRRAVHLLRQAGRIIESRSFTVHTQKSKIIPPGARKIVLGLLIADERLRLLPEFCRRLETHIRGTELFGAAAHAKHRNFASPMSMINHIDGCIAFARSVDSNSAERLQRRWRSVLERQGLSLLFTQPDSAPDQDR